MNSVDSILKTPKVSIIITFYNLGEYIQDCVSSVLKQKYENWELIIVNDCSNKKNSEIVNKIHHEKIKIINLKENKGQLLAFIEGLKISTGEFICMLDSDDILLPNFLETLLYIHLNNNAAFVSCACGEINENNEITSLNYVNNPIKLKKEDFNEEEIQNMFNTKESYSLEFLTTKNLPFALWGWNPSSSAMFRKNALKILDYYPDKAFWKTGADKVVFSLSHLIGGSINTSAVCFLYRHHDKNNSKTTLTTGQKKFLNEEYIKTLINWNKKIRLDTIKMFLSNKKTFVQKFNKINYLKMLFSVIFCINGKICAKILKTFAHKLIKF